MSSEGVGSRLTPEQVDNILNFAQITAQAWQEASKIKVGSSWSLYMTVTRLPDIRDWSSPNLDIHATGYSCPGSVYNGKDVPHNEAWYRDNATRKDRICLQTQMDSMEAVRLFPGLVRHIESAYPWGGGIFDPHYGLILSTSGFRELEDILFSRTVRNFAVMLMDFEGEEVIGDAHKRGDHPSETERGQRFTLRPSGILAPREAA